MNARPPLFLFLALTMYGSANARFASDDVSQLYDTKLKICFCTFIGTPNFRPWSTTSARLADELASLGYRVHERWAARASLRCWKTAMGRW